ncbi:protein CDC73 homolog [Triticum aestivum]|uniref:protein CDC73 homolog n=1 Tax=Triticum aestivum TaxID=4565 RepID=UPI001D011B06|nr:protein CDC73 homolog [Triticum aestivum]
MDPLAVLRDYAARGDLDKIIFNGDDVLFGDDYTFPANAPTAFTSKQSGRPYPLSAAVFLAQHNDLKHTDFLQAARLRRIPPVSLPDRKTFLDFLHFGDSSLPSAEPLLPSSFAQDAHPPPPPPLPEDEEGEGPDADDASTAHVRALERPLKDRNAVLDARGRDFLAIYHAALRREEDRLRNKDAAPSATGRHEPSSTAAASLANPKLDKSLGDGFVPIILVPSASQTLITIYNVRDFLEDFVFVPSDEKMRAMKGSPKPECVTLQKKHVRGAGGPVAFEVRDKPASLKADDWARVVAVFVLGKEWQFKDWPFKGHVDIFNKVIGFFVRFEDDSVDSAKVVKQWNVKIISISKNKRHQDRPAALEVWDRLDEFVRAVRVSLA